MTDLEEKRAKAHSSMTWGAYTILVFYTPPETRESQPLRADLSLGPKRKLRVPARWGAAAFRPGKSAAAYSVLVRRSRKAAVMELRRRMRKEMDRIPDRVDWLEQEYARLREALSCMP